jgi:hypothetical protein
MKKFLRTLIVWVTLISTFPITSAQQIDSQWIIDWLNTQWMTIYTTLEDYRAEDKITRWEASKMIAQYALSLQLAQNYTWSCEFTDTATYDTTLQPSIRSSCAYWLLKGWNGLFNPNDSLTQAQALVIIERARSWFQNENVTPWYREYFQWVVSLWIVESDQINSVATTPISRLELWAWLYYASSTIQPQTQFIAQSAVAIPPVVTRSWDTQTTPTTSTTPQWWSSTSLPSTYTKSSADESKFSSSYSRSYNYSTYQKRSQTTQEYELSQWKNIVIFFASQSEIASRSLDSSIKSDGVRWNVIVLLAEYETSSTLRTTYGVSSPHTLVYLNASWNKKFSTIKQDFQISVVIDNANRGYVEWWSIIKI